MGSWVPKSTIDLSFGDSTPRSSPMWPPRRMRKLVTVIKLVDLYFKRASARLSLFCATNWCFSCLAHWTKPWATATMEVCHPFRFCWGGPSEGSWRKLWLLLFFISKTANVDAAEVKNFGPFIRGISNRHVWESQLWESQRSLNYFGFA